MSRQTEKCLAIPLLIYLFCKRMSRHYGIFMQQDAWMVAKFRLSESWNAQIFFAVDIFERFRQVAYKFAVDHGKGPFKLCVCFFCADVKRVIIDGRTICECHQFVVNAEESALSAEVFPVFKHVGH